MTLPDDTTVYNGHEYTLSNARFGSTIDPSNAHIKALLSLAEKHGHDLAHGGTTGRTTIGDEKGWNVFVRVDSREVGEATGLDGEVERMRRLREMKNNA
jgi:hydroxyacylglutathione hydrolase